MTDTRQHSLILRQRFSDAWLAVRRSFAEFLALPTWIIAGFLLLAGVSYVLDVQQYRAFGRIRELLVGHFFADANATGELLGTIAGGVITVTSITISLLLIALQQSAATMTSAVFDQFLRRRHNQIYFGFFIGLALYALITLATVNAPFNPVLGATLVSLLTIVGLYLLLLLLYTTINQMRPGQIIEAVHDHTLAARERQLKLLQRFGTRRQSAHMARSSVHAERHGFVTHIDPTTFEDAVGRPAEGFEVVLHVPIGSFVSFGDRIATVFADDEATATQVCDRVRGAVRLELERDLSVDPAFGIHQLEMIGWTSISTSKSNPIPGLLAIQALRDLLARWSDEEPQKPPEDAVLPVVYVDETLPRLMDAFESLAVASTESMQHQCFSEIVRTFDVLFERLPSEQRRRSEDLILRILSGLGDHVPTADLDAALVRYAETIERLGSLETAERVRHARSELDRSVGLLNSRSSRVPTHAGRRAEP